MQLFMPMPRHMISPETEAGREMIREWYAGARSRAFVEQPIARNHADHRPWRGQLVPAGAKRLASLAEAAGFEVRIDETMHGCVVSGHRAEPRCGFRASWTRGLTSGASWHEPLRYEMVEDRRPVEIDQRSRVGKVGFRTTGQSAYRLSLVATPTGLPLGVRALEDRLRGLIDDVRVE